MSLPACLLALALAAEPAKHPFDFADGDRVVFLGSTLIEREQKYGSWELALTLRNKDKAVTFRNLGWSGDTVWCESRGSFDGPKKGFENTVALVKELKPTVIVLCYGQVESFDGPAGVAKFTEGYGKLLDALGPTKARFVLMTPTLFQNAGPTTDAEKKNANLKLYMDATKAVAGKRSLAYWDAFSTPRPAPSLTNNLDTWPATTANGIHLSDAGYFWTAALFAPNKLSPVEGHVPAREDLRKAIVAKNELFFHRWRPQNVTYLTGFRKKEQGQNAKEIAEFDPLIEAAEKQIASLMKKID